jgi:hypothetical protein
LGRAGNGYRPRSRSAGIISDLHADRTGRAAIKGDSGNRLRRGRAADRPAAKIVFVQRPERVFHAHFSEFDAAGTLHRAAAHIERPITQRDVAAEGEGEYARETQGREQSGTTLVVFSRARNAKSAWDSGRSMITGRCGGNWHCRWNGKTLSNSSAKSSVSLPQETRSP